MEKDKIYYYTSNYVLNSWILHEKIWATRSVTSNDISDTTHAAKLFPQIKRMIIDEYKSVLKDVEQVLHLNRCICMKLHKELLYYTMLNHYDTFKKIVYSEAERLNWFYYGNRYKLFRYEEYDENCGSFHRPYLQNPSREQWIFSNLLKALSDKELSQLFNVTEKMISGKRKVIEQLPYMHYPFVICFTTELDNRFLWDSYTRNEGVALEFSRKELQDYFAKISSNKMYQYKLEDIVYDERQQVKEIVDSINNWEGELLFTGYETIYSDMIKYKNPYWKEEKEVRGVFYERYFESPNKIKENYNLKYRSDLVTQDYIEIPIPHEMVKRIIIGPQNDIRGKNKGLYNNILSKFNVDFSYGFGISNI